MWEYDVCVSWNVFLFGWIYEHTAAGRGLLLHLGPVLIEIWHLDPHRFDEHEGIKEVHR